MGILKMRKIFSLKESLNKNMQSAQNTHRLSDEELLALQKKLMESYQDIYEVCKKYQIKPIIEGGSLLGYVRHNGFIPWDDDLDFAMSREDYEKFKKIFHKELSDRYILSVPNGGNVTVNRFMQIYVKNTRLVTADMSKNQPKHIAIDIFPIDFVPQNEFLIEKSLLRSVGKRFSQVNLSDRRITYHCPRLGLGSVLIPVEIKGRPWGEYYLLALVRCL